jgi:tetratricopeptide (TPR) repeat protein
LLLKESVELNPKDANAHYKLGLVYEFKKDYDAAATQYKEAVELKSDFAKALNALGRVHMRTGQIAQAKEVLELAKKADPSQEETTVLLSSIKDELSPEPQKYHKKWKKSKKRKGAKKRNGARVKSKPTTKHHAKATKKKHQAATAHKKK